MHFIIESTKYVMSVCCFMTNNENFNWLEIVNPLFSNLSEGHLCGSGLLFNSKLRSLMKF